MGNIKEEFLSEKEKGKEKNKINKYQFFTQE